MVWLGRFLKYSEDFWWAFYAKFSRIRFHLMVKLTGFNFSVATEIIADFWNHLHSQFMLTAIYLFFQRGCWLFRPLTNWKYLKIFFQFLSINPFFSLVYGRKIQKEFIFLYLKGWIENFRFFPAKFYKFGCCRMVDAKF